MSAASGSSSGGLPTGRSRRIRRRTAINSRRQIGLPPTSGPWRAPASTPSGPTPRRATRCSIRRRTPACASLPASPGRSMSRFSMTGSWRAPRGRRLCGRCAASHSIRRRCLSRSATRSRRESFGGTARRASSSSCARHTTRPRRPPPTPCLLTSTTPRPIISISPASMCARSTSTCTGRRTCAPTSRICNWSPADGRWSSPRRGPTACARGTTGRRRSPACRCAPRSKKGRRAWWSSPGPMTGGEAAPRWTTGSSA